LDWIEVIITIIIIILHNIIIWQPFKTLEVTEQDIKPENKIGYKKIQSDERYTTTWNVTGATASCPGLLLSYFPYMDKREVGGRGHRLLEHASATSLCIINNPNMAST